MRESVDLSGGGCVVLLRSFHFERAFAQLLVDHFPRCSGPGHANFVLCLTLGQLLGRFRRSREVSLFHILGGGL